PRCENRLGERAAMADRLDERDLIAGEQTGGAQQLADKVVDRLRARGLLGLLRLLRSLGRLDLAAVRGRRGRLAVLEQAAAAVKVFGFHSCVIGGMSTTPETVYGATRIRRAQEEAQVAVEEPFAGKERYNRAERQEGAERNRPLSPRHSFARQNDDAHRQRRE